MSATVGLLHPGAMGASVGAAARAGGARVLWSSDGRGPATRERAAAGGLEDAGSLDRLTDEAEIVISLCPPTAAGEVAEHVAARGFRGVYVDANALAPETARGIARRFEGTGARFVDGGVIGPPARRPGATHLYLCGPEAGRVADLFADGPLEAHVLDGPVGAASALKMAFAGWTKGTSALLAAIVALAEQEGVAEPLFEIWSKLQPDLPDRVRVSLPAVAPKAWRFVGEMREIASTFEAAGLPPEFHRAAAEIYARLADFKDADPPPTVESVTSRLRRE